MSLVTAIVPMYVATKDHAEDINPAIIPIAIVVVAPSIIIPSIAISVPIPVTSTEIVIA